MGGVISVLRIFSKSHLPPMAPGAMLRAAGSPAVSNPFENIPRWQLLSALAIPVGLGLGYLYYRQRQTPPIAKPPNTVPDPVIPHQRALNEGDLTAGEKGDLSTLYLYRAGCYEQQDNDEMAMSDCSKSFDLNPRFEKVLGGYRPVPIQESPRGLAC